MIFLRKSSERGYARHGDGWKAGTDFRLPITTIQRIGGGAGFDMRGYRNTEILIYVLSGTLLHHDRMGHGEDICNDKSQIMSGA